MSEEYVNAFWEHEKTKDVDFIMVLRKYNLDGHVAALIFREYVRTEESGLSSYRAEPFSSEEKERMLQDLAAYFDTCKALQQKFKETQKPFV